MTDVVATPEVAPKTPKAKPAAAEGAVKLVSGNVYTPAG